MTIFKDTPDNMVFVFGSNEGGIHGGGAARHAYKTKGARWGFSYGHMGQSFAIPTKGFKRIFSKDPSPHTNAIVGDTLALPMIRRYVEGFLAYATGHPEIDFQVTCIGCGLAGLKHEDIAPMFILNTTLADGSVIQHVPANLHFDEKWKPWLGDVNYWGEG